MQLIQSGRVLLKTSSNVQYVLNKHLGPRVDGVKAVETPPARSRRDRRESVVLLELPALAGARPVCEVVGLGVVGHVLAGPVDGGQQREAVGVRLAHGGHRGFVRDGRARRRRMDWMSDS